MRGLPAVTAAGLVVLVFVSCTSIGHLDRSQPTGGEIESEIQARDVPVCGFLVIAQSDRGRIDGELIEVRNGVLLVLSDNGIVELPADELSRVQVITSEPTRRTETVLWGVSGTLSTLSHGAFLIFTMPVWISTSIGTARWARIASRITVGHGELEQLWQYARYPDGLPGGSLDDLHTCPARVVPAAR